MNRHLILAAALVATMCGAVHADSPALAQLNLYAGSGSAPLIPQAAAAVAVNKGYLQGLDPAAVNPPEFVSIPGARPAHEVVIKTFGMSRTAVTVEQYAQCVREGRCAAPGTGGYCNWGKPGRELHPVNCVDWDQANQYASFMGARLPSEAEWEYAATSGGGNRKYPWGNEEPGCGLAVMNAGGQGCDKSGTLPVCSRPGGNTAQGLCDMAGNVWQWVQDKYQTSYAGAPGDGAAFEAAGVRRVLRGGSFYNSAAGHLRSDNRYSVDPGCRYGMIGFRLAR